MARTPENSIVPPTITLAMRNRPELKSDGSNCSNPQQGTVRSRIRMEKFPPSNGPAARLETPVTTVSGESNDQSMAMTKTSQEDGTKMAPRYVEPRPTLKIPPTLRDIRKLFVGGLPLDVTSQEFLEFFQRFGTVMDSVVMYDRTTRKPRGFGFVTFADPAVAARILQMEGDDEQYGPTDYHNKPRSGRMEMRGKMIEIKAAQPKETLPPPRHGYPHHHIILPGTPLAPVRESRPMPYALGHYDHVAKHPATLPVRHLDSIDGYQIPPTPIPHYQHDPVMTPEMPQQAAFDMALDMAHHMMFYSQLLATPTLMPLVSPMVPPSPKVLGFEPPSYRDCFQPFQVQSDGSDRRSMPRSPIPSVPKVCAGEPFKIGGASFFPETASSLALHPAKPGIPKARDEENWGAIGDAVAQ